MGLWPRLLRVLRRRRFDDDDLRRELGAHVELEIEERLAEGLSPEAARTAALRAVGNVTLIEEQVHDLSPWAWWDSARQDVRYALRTFRRRPAFAVTAVLTLALGIGANGAMFSVVDALVLRPLPVPHPRDLVVIRDLENGNYSYPDYIALRDGDGPLAALLAASSLQRFTVSAGTEAEKAAVRLVTANYFATLGVVPAAGRLLGGSDTTPEAVISDGYWARRFARSQDALGRLLRVNGVALTVVGVAPRGFFGETPGESPDVYASLALQRPQGLTERGFSWLYLMGRLKPGATAAQAQASLSARVAAIASPDMKNPGARTFVIPGVAGNGRWRERVGSPLWVLTAVVGIVLLIACANLATLLVTRGAARRREIAMRMAIGASRGRIVRQLLTETLLLSATGGLASVVLALWGGRLLVQMASAIGTGPELDLGLAIDARLLVFTALASIGAGLVFGLAPAIQEVRTAGRGLTVSHQRIVSGERARGVRGALITIQVALSIVLVAGSVMFLRTLTNLASQPLGFRAEGLLRVELEPERGYRPAAAVFPTLLDRVAALPGVTAATTVVGGTLANIGGVYGLQFEGFTLRGEQDGRARADWVGPEYFRTAGMRLIAGREFSVRDAAESPRVAVLNQAAARFYFGGDAAALNRRFTFNTQEYEIVGIAENAKYADLRETTPRMIYFAGLQGATPPHAIEVRTAAPDPRGLAPAIRAAVHDVDPRLSAGETLTLAERVDRKLGREHLVASLSTFFGALTLLLVSVGIYGTLAYVVGQRTKEIGMRLALGAKRVEVLWLVLREIVVILAIGTAAGAAGAVGAGRFVRSLLFGLEPADAVTLATAAAILATVALAAGFLPAFRASRLDPAEVLRE